MESLQLQWAKSFMEAPAELQNLNNLFDYLKGSKYEIYIQLLLKEESFQAVKKKVLTGI